MLQCTHHEACMYRYIHQGIRRKYCMACVVEKFPDCEINSEAYKKKWEISIPKKVEPEKFISVKPKPEKIVTEEKVDVELEPLPSEENHTGPIKRPKVIKGKKNVDKKTSNQ